MSGQVSVACKMPGGLILRLWDFHEVNEQAIGGGTRKIRVARRRPIPDIVLKGCAHAPNEAPGPHLFGGYGLTHGVDEDVFVEWLKQNAESDLVKNHIVFSQGKPDAIQAKVKEHKHSLSGLEPLNTETVFKEGAQINTDVRWPRKIQKGERTSMS